MRGVFAKDVSQLATMTQHAVPPFLERSFAFLLAKDRLRREGIFRISGLKSEVESYYRHINATGDATFPEDCNPHVVANLVTRFFREIPNHILIDANASAWDDVRTAKDIKHRVDLLPVVNRAILSRTIAFLSIAVSEKWDNRMSVNAIARILKPSLITKPNPMWLLADEVAELFFTSYAEIFEGISSLSADGRFLSPDEFDNLVGPDVLTDCFAVSVVMLPNLKEEKGPARICRQVHIPAVAMEAMIDELLKLEDKPQKATGFQLIPL
jgi:hypothetical protein